MTSDKTDGVEDSGVDYRLATRGPEAYRPEASGDVSAFGASNQNQPPLVDLLISDPGVQTSLEPDASLHYGQGENALDLADILNGQAGSDNIDGYLLAISHGSSSTLLVDTCGTGNFTNPDLVLEIGGVDWDSGTAGQMADLVTDAVIVVA